jgi:hypothetical protein
VEIIFFLSRTDDGLVDAITSMTRLSLKGTRLGPMSSHNSMAANATVANKQTRRTLVARCGEQKVALSGLGYKAYENVDKNNR